MTTDTLQTRFVTYVYVRGHATDPDDRGVPGYYAVELSCDDILNLNQLSAIEVNHVIDAALDEFFNNQTIEMVDDFEIIVYLDDGSVLNYDASLQSTEQLFFADYLGKIAKPDILKKR